MAETPLARYRLRTSRLHCFGLGLGVALASALVVGLLAIDFHGIYLGIAGWALLIAAVCFAFWLGTLIPRHCVASGGEIVVHRDRVLIPRAFSGPPEEVPFHELEIEVQVQQERAPISIDGARHEVAFARPTMVLIGRRERPRKLHPSVFTGTTHPMRLADDVRRLRAGLSVADHENLDVGALFDDFQQALAAMNGAVAAVPEKDEYDERLDDELRALDAPKKSEQK